MAHRINIMTQKNTNPPRLPVPCFSPQRLQPKPILLDGAGPWRIIKGGYNAE